MKDMPDDWSDSDVGWWSYVKNSVTQHHLGDKPTHWISLPKPKTITINGVTAKIDSIKRLPSNDFPRYEISATYDGK